MITVKEKVKIAMTQLGCKGKVEIATLSIGRVIVWLNGERFGIFDTNRNTFVD